MHVLDRLTAVCCDRVQNVPGLANYVTKNVKDRSKVEMPLQEWNGRRCRLVWRSRGFLSKSKDRLCQEQRAEWYPQAKADAALHGSEESPDNRQTASTTPATLLGGNLPRLVARWPSQLSTARWRRSCDPRTGRAIARWYPGGQMTRGP